MTLRRYDATYSFSIEFGLQEKIASKRAFRKLRFGVLVISSSNSSKSSKVFSETTFSVSLMIWKNSKVDIVCWFSKTYSAKSSTEPTFSAQTSSMIRTKSSLSIFCYLSHSFSAQKSLRFIFWFSIFTELLHSLCFIFSLSQTEKTEFAFLRMFWVSFSFLCTFLVSIFSVFAFSSKKWEIDSLRAQSQCSAILSNLQRLSFC